MNKRRACVNVTGHVQGVSFRYATYRQALILGAGGWVKNLPDGSVQVCIEGDAATVGQLLDWLHDGPPSARVDAVTIEHQDYIGEFSGFEIRR